MSTHAESKLDPALADLKAAHPDPDGLIAHLGTQHVADLKAAFANAKAKTVGIWENRHGAPNSVWERLFLAAEACGLLTSNDGDGNNMDIVNSILVDVSELPDDADASDPETMTVTRGDLEIILRRHLESAGLLTDPEPQEKPMISLSSRQPDPELERLLERARNHVMTPDEVRAQRLSYIRAETGMSDEAILRVLPELTPIKEAGNG